MRFVWYPIGVANAALEAKRTAKTNGIGFACACIAVANARGNVIAAAAAFGMNCFNNTVTK